MSESKNATEPRPDDRVRFGLRGRLLLVTLLFVNAAFLAVWLISTSTARQGLLSLSETNLGLGAENLASAVTQVLDDTHADAVTTARLDLPSQAIDTDDPKNVEWYANEMVRTKSKYAAIVVANKSGLIVASNTLGRDGRPLRVALRGKSLAHESFDAAALHSGHGVGVPVLPSRPAFLEGVLGPEEQVLGFSLPILDVMDEVVGTLTVLVSVDYLSGMLDGYTRASNGSVDSLAVLVDRDGRVVAAPAKLPGAARYRGAVLPANARSSSAELKSWSGPFGSEFLLAPKPVRGTAESWGFQLVVMKTSAALEAPVRAIGRRLLIVFSGALVLATLGLAFMTTRFLDPMRRLTSAILATERAADFQPPAVSSGDEVGALNRAFARTFSTIREYEGSLERKVAERTRELADAKQEVSDILDNMRQAIFTLDARGAINGEFSAHTRELFGNVPIAGEPVMDVLQITEQRDAETFSRMRFWLSNIVGTDELQWFLSEGEPPRALEYMRPGSDGATERRALELEYAPIMKSGAVHKVMVIAKDVTKVHELQAEVARKESEHEANLERIAELVDLDPELFETFLAESVAILEQCDEAVSTLERAPADRAGVDALFRYMHTLKGNARIFKITTVQNAAHAVEEQIEELRSGQRDVTPEAASDLRSRVALLRGLLRDLERLGRKVLRGSAEVSEDAGKRRTTVARVAETRILEVRKAYKELSRVLVSAEKSMPGDVARLHDALGRVVQALTVVPTGDLFGRMRKMVLDLAGELEKRLEDLTTSGDEIEVDAKVLDKMKDVLLHALRNAVDHGIETPAERRAAGKSEKGQIQVKCAWEQGAGGNRKNLVFEISDDGAGIDVERVKAKAYEDRLFSEQQLGTLAPAEVMQILFRPGFSLARRITTISGRGVGLDVIAATMKELRGEARLTSERGRGTTLSLKIPADYYQAL
jgi:two-component system chemotaxis sensor kinase CheA